MEDLILTKGQQDFYDAAINGRSVFLQGKAGVGKTFVTKKVIEQLKGEGKNIAVIAPTGVAANNVGGATMHSLFALPVFGVITYEECNYVKNVKRRLYEKIDVILIDEVSMVRCDMIDGIEYTLKKNGCGSLMDKQIIFVGDMGQLPPVADDNFKSVLFKHGYRGIEFYNAHIMRDLIDKGMLSIELEEVKRQSDPEFISALNTIREGKKHPYFKRFHNNGIKGIVLAPHKITVSKYNLEGLEMQKGKEYTFKAEMDGKIKLDDFNFDETVTVKHGCRIMYLINSKNNNLVNGTIGTFHVKEATEEDPEAYFIVVDNIKYEISLAEVTKKEYVLDEVRDEIFLKTIGTIRQMPIRLAYALTIHKSQGLTFDEVTVDLSLPCFNKGAVVRSVIKSQNPGRAFYNYR